MYTEQDGYDGVPGWCTHCWGKYRHHTIMCHKYHVKHTAKQCHLDRLKSECKRKVMRRQPVRCLCMPHRRTLFGEGWGRWAARLSEEWCRRRLQVRQRPFFMLAKGIRGWDVVWSDCYPRQNRPMPRALFTKKRTRDLGPMLEKKIGRVWLGPWWMGWKGGVGCEVGV